MLSGNGHLAIIAALLMITTSLAGCATPQQTGETASACLDAEGGGMEAVTSDAATASDAPATADRGEHLLAPDTDTLQPTGDPIKIGTLLPLTGQLKDFGPDMQSAVELAVKEVNDAGGIMGRPVEVVQGDSQTDPSQAPQELNRLRQEGIVGFVGAASSGVSSSVIEQAVSNEIAMVTPASTSPALTEDRDNNGFFYRVPPSDALQGKVMAQLLEQDGIGSIATIFVNNDYGQGFNDVLVEEFDGTVAAEISFDNDATSFNSEISQLAGANADAVVAIMYPGNGVPVMREAFNQGVTSDKEFYFSEGVKDESGFVAQVGNTSTGDSLLAGCKGTTPEDFESNATAAFEQKFQDEYDHEPGLFAAHSYDAAVSLMAAIAHAGSTDAAEYKGSMRTVWNAPGQEVSDPAQAVTLASAGTDIDYRGASGNFDWAEDGEPSTGLYGIWEIQSDGSIEILESGIQP